MNERHLVAGGAAVAGMVAVATIVWVMLSPGWAVDVLGRIAAEQLGRGFSAKGSTFLDFSPLSIRIEEPVMAGNAETGDSLMTASSLVIPITLGGLVSHQPDLSRIRLADAEFALIIDERGRASWDFPEAKAGQEMSISLEQASFRYFDARNDQALSLANIDGVMRIAADGGVTFTGSAVLSSHVARVDLQLKSLPRVNQDGSPLELAIESDVASASFSGRLSTAKVLSLAGPVSLTSRETAAVARWAGIPLADSAVMPGPLNLDGALDSAGRAYAIRNAAVTLGQFRAGGDVGVDLRGARPKLQLKLEADTLWLDTLLPEPGAEDGSWGRANLPAALLRAIDAEVSIVARRLNFRSLEAGASRVAADLADGKLTSSGALRMTGGGTTTFTATADAVVLPPAGTLVIKAENTELKDLLTALTGVPALSGQGSLTLDLAAEGRTQEELAGTLKGTASLTLSGGRLEGADLAGTASAVSQKILDGWSAVPGGTPIDSLTASLGISDGLASITQADVKSGALGLRFSGTADLLKRSVDLKAEFEPPETAPLPVPVIVKGNWAAPRIYPDIPEILTNPDSGFARLRTGGTPPAN